MAAWATRLEPDAADMLRTRLGWAEWELRAGRFEAADATLEALRPLFAGKPPALVFRHQALVNQRFQHFAADLGCNRLLMRSQA